MSDHCNEYDIIETRLSPVSDTNESAMSLDERSKNDFKYSIKQLTVYMQRQVDEDSIDKNEDITNNNSNSNSNISDKEIRAIVSDNFSSVYVSDSSSVDEPTNKDVGVGTGNVKYVNIAIQINPNTTSNCSQTHCTTVDAGTQTNPVKSSYILTYHCKYCKTSYKDLYSFLIHNEKSSGCFKVEKKHRIIVEEQLIKNRRRRQLYALTSYTLLACFCYLLNK
jgi:hypothetical protein